MTEGRLREGRYQEIFEKDVSASLILSPEADVLACNQAALSLFGFDSKEAMRQSSAAGTFPSLADRASILRQVELPGSSTPHAVRLHRCNGSSVLTVGTFAGYRNDSGTLIDIHCHLTDSTEKRRAHRKVIRLTSQLLNAQNEERRKLSHDLHDSTGQTLSALGMHLGMLQAKWPEIPEKAAEYLAACQDLVQDCVRDIRTVSYSLHPPLLDELGIGAALRWYVEGFSSRSAISVSVDINENIGRPSREIAAAIFRIVQEGLTNVHRHSKSKTARIQLETEAAQIVLTISDEGCGFPSRHPGKLQIADGIGIASIRQQVALVGGHLEITSDAGTKLSVYIPTHI